MDSGQGSPRRRWRLPPHLLHVLISFVAFFAVFVLVSSASALDEAPGWLRRAGSLDAWIVLAAVMALFYPRVYTWVERKRGTRLPGRPEGRWVVVVVAVAVVAGVGGHQVVFRRAQDERERDRVMDVARGKAEQVSEWVSERERDARFLHTSTHLALLAREWSGGDDLSRERLLGRLEQYRSDVYRSIWLLDARGDVLLVNGEGGDLPAPIREEARVAAARHHVGLLGSATVGGAERVYFVSQLAELDGGEGPILVFEVDPGEVLLPVIARWPFDTRTGEVILGRVDGASFVPFTAITDRGAIATDGAFEVTGDDDRLIAGAAVAVKGTPWTLVARIDHAELAASGNDAATWMALAVTLGFFTIATASILIRQQDLLVSGQRNAEAQAERLRVLRLLDAIVSSSTDAIFAKDMAGRYLLFNREAARVTGRPAEAVLGHDDTVVFPPDQARVVMEHDRVVRESGTPLTREVTLQTAHGERVFLATKGPLRDEHGVVIGSFGISRDISRRKEEERALVAAERALRASEAHLRSVVAALSEGVMVFDLRGRVISCNASAARIVGMREEELLTSPVGLQDWPVYRQDGSPMPFSDLPMAQTLATGEPRRGVLVGQAVHGVAQWLLVNSEPMLDGQGMLQSVVVSFTDITARVEAERELDRHRHHLLELVEERTGQIEGLNKELAQRADQAEAATLAKSAFLANVSHEIRTPMNAILGFTHLVARGEADPERLAMLGKIADAGHHLLGVINDVLDLSKIEAGKLTMEEVDFELETMVARVASLISERREAKGLDLNVEMVGVPSVLHADPTRLAQALLNYLVNAVKFTDEGSILLRGERIPSDDGRVWLRFSVSDTGIGIAPEARERLFSAFEQLDPTATRRHGGTGLGLAITRRLAERMGGSVGVESELGRGSTFWFTVSLPPATRGMENRRARPATSGPSPEVALRAWHAGARVLLAEDNALNQEVVRELLQTAGLVVEVADDGREAVERARAGAFDVILMDMQMPEMDGIDATRIIRTLPAHARTPILALTANAFGEDKAACLAAGMNDHVSKPVDPTVLFDTLLRWLPRTTPSPRFEGDVA